MAQFGSHTQKILVHDGESMENRKDFDIQKLILEGAFAVRSTDAVRIEPSLAKTAETTPSLWPEKVLIHSPVRTYQSLAVPS